MPFVSLNGSMVAVEQIVMEDMGLKPGQQITHQQLGRILEGNLACCIAMREMQRARIASAARKKQ